MADRRKKMLARLYTSNPTKEEQILIQLTIERICADMTEFYERFYAMEGPGALVYVPMAEEEDDSMFYLPVKALVAALDDFRGNEMEGPADVMQKAIVRAEALDPEKEALFIIQDDSQMSLVHYNREKPTQGPIIT